MLAAQLFTVGFSAPAPLATRVPAASSSVRMAIEDMEGIGPETGGKLFDPFGFTQYGSAKTLAWYRAAELKHGRVCMLASLGIAYTCSGGPLFPGAISTDGTTFASLGKDPWAAFDAMPTSGKVQMAAVIGLLEFHSELTKPHYLSGGTPGKIIVGGWPLFDPLGFMNGMSEAEKSKKLTSELKNGRLAMIGVASFFAAHWSPIAVPLLSGKIPMGDAANPTFGLGI